MDCVMLGTTGLSVSSLCFGTMTFATQSDMAQSIALYRRCREAGINFFDCADVYSDGNSEVFLSECIKNERDDIILTSKVGGRAWEGENGAGLSRTHIILACEKSLKRLKTDYLDIYFVHIFDENVAIEETLEALTELKTSGKIRHLGVSNWAAWQIAKSHGISALQNFAKFEVVQPMYSLIKRQVEVEILPMAKNANMGVISYNPLGGGLLTGKYGTDIAAGNGRIAGDKGYSKRYGDKWMLESADGLCKIADEIGCHSATLAVAFAAKHPDITCPIIGARNVEQLEDLLKAVDFNMDEELYNRLISLTPKVPGATNH